MQRCAQVSSQLRQSYFGFVQAEKVRASVYNDALVCFMSRAVTSTAKETNPKIKSSTAVRLLDY